MAALRLPPPPPPPGRESRGRRSRGRRRTSPSVSPSGGPRASTCPAPLSSYAHPCSRPLVLFPPGSLASDGAGFSLSVGVWPPQRQGGGERKNRWRRRAALKWSLLPARNNPAPGMPCAVYAPCLSPNVTVRRTRAGAGARSET